MDSLIVFSRVRTWATVHLGWCTALKRRSVPTPNLATGGGGANDEFLGQEPLVRFDRLSRGVDRDRLCHRLVRLRWLTATRAAAIRTRFEPWQMPFGNGRRH